ncbi:UDP-N-acetylmuramoyl-tripeptide--D-alanyl-D-alanine ligase [Nocardioides sp. T2.26MG-1]|uniref:UDP-N-acetylmuramoyl-tripeptide--D-alanyl-D- alanine ligase n=1 Tax=Nocardioides sp. T2.26MG-1 TaxID=3041166 RepID=UPI0025401A80|nr:UDP-N-acetylmuramoyl-tripeptide--D-alanyl-D-alanine ligase [Nocardioides sp. T2.26MG-1]
MTLGKIAKVVGGQVVGDPDIVVDAPAYVDTRKAVPGGLFVAVVGEHVDGHDYAAGAHAVLGSSATEAPTVVVRDPVVALGKLAAYVVRRLDATVLAVTGSQGKTGTKDYLAHLLRPEGSTVATDGSFNNELGLPLTVLRAHAETRFLVLEMGARRIGHIRHLCEIAPPQVAAVLNVGTAHIGEFGSRDSIAFAKGEIIQALPSDGTAVLNAGDPLVAAMASRTQAHVLTFGPDDADVSERGTEVDDLGRVSFEIGYADEWHQVRLQQTGLHQAQNALAAATMALAVGVPLDRIATALSAATASSPMRMEMHERDDGLIVVNDAYNANPASATAALEALAIIGHRRHRRTVAVLGEMLDLGRESFKGHVQVGRAAARLGTDLVVVVGAAAGGIVEGLEAVAAWSGDALVAEHPAEAIEWLRENVEPEDVVLVKASHGVGLWVVADALLDPDLEIEVESEVEGDGSTP